MRLYRDGRQIFESPEEVYKIGGSTAFKLLPDILGRKKGSFFYGGVSPSKIGLIAPS
jgi:hypothetical protein